MNRLTSGKADAVLEIRFEQETVVEPSVHSPQT